MENTAFLELKDKVCVITGGAGVIGSSVVRGLARVGLKSVILDIDGGLAEKLAAEVKAETGAEVIGLKADVLSRESLEKALETIHQKFGRIAYLINGAGGNSAKATTPVEMMDENNKTEWDKNFFGLGMEGFDWVFDLNFKGTLLPTMVLGKDMVEDGRGAILNISSMTSYKPLTKIPAYSAAKSAVNSFTEWLSVHLAKTGVRVNAIAPGFFLTNQNRFLLVDEKSGNPTPRGEKIIYNTPMGRYGDVDELQGTILYLLSDLSAFVTGVVIPVDGGYSAFGGV
ncbi:MAG TPA: SDR family oxidoreductase [Bacteroides sp.]|nr:SDR family oxidoreductase [Bacteroides sp.]